MQTLHVISHTHWDREWYLTFQQFRMRQGLRGAWRSNMAEEEREALPVAGGTVRFEVGAKKIVTVLLQADG